MRKWVSLFLALALLAVFSLGCAGVARDTKVKCPKCGAVFTVDEGVAEMASHRPRAGFGIAAAARGGPGGQFRSLVRSDCERLFPSGRAVPPAASDLGKAAAIPDLRVRCIQA